MSRQSSILVTILCLSSLAARAEITVTNLKDKETLRYPVAMLRGTTDQTGEVKVVNRDNSRPDGRNAAPIVDGLFVVLVELRPGANRLRLEAGKSRRDLTLRYTPMTTPYRVNIVFVTGEEGDTTYQTQKVRDPQDYRDKLDTAAKLMQTFTAERMNDIGFGRKTFNLEFDKDGKVVVHVARYPEPAQELRSKDGSAWYGPFYPWIEKQFPMDRNKNLVVMAFTYKDPVTKRVGGHTALGGGGMGLFGSGSMFAWPDSIRDVCRAFSDTTPVDGDRVDDDSAFRSTFWGLAATTIGAMLHEIGHTFGLPHSPDGESIMSRGFDHFNRAFTIIEPPREGGTEPFRFMDCQAAYWDAPFADLLNFSPWFQPDARPFQAAAPPTVKLDAASDEVVVEAPCGIGAVVIQPESRKRISEVFQKDAPQVLRFKRDELREKVGAPNGAQFIVTDTQGNMAFVDEGKLAAP
jgi:hypothetical protein